MATDEQDGNAEKNKSNTENKRSYINPASEQSLVDAARAGKVPETVQYFSAITQLDKSMIEHCIFKAHLPALMVLCKAHSLASSTFTAILQLRENHTETPIDDTVGLMRRYDGMTPDTAKRIIRFSDKRRALDDG